jgi:signal transduction histidine kinase
VQQLKGTLQVRDANPGTEFIVTLPRPAARQAASLSASRGSPSR